MFAILKSLVNGFLCWPLLGSDLIYTQFSYNQKSEGPKDKCERMFQESAGFHLKKVFI